MWFGKDKMKKLFLALAMAVPAFAAPMAPLYFDNISGDQDEYWNYLMMFKLWGTNGIESKTINLPDTIGWVGTAKNGFLAKNANIKLGGPLIFGGDVDFRSNAMDASFVSGPVRVSGDVHMNVRDTIHGTVCVQGTYNKSDDANFDGIAGALYTGSSATTGACADTNVAFVRTDLAAPLLNPAKEYSGVVDISISGQGSIVVPEKTSEKDSVYDLYLERISIGNDGKLYIDMPKGGRLTRIFLKQLSFGTHPSIQVREEGAIIENKKYRGNLLFYVPHGLEFSRTDNYPIQGTFISTDTISILCNMKYAGQMIANKLVLGDQIDGKEFIYKPFDPPEIDPTTLAKGTFKEDNEINWEIPITLDEKAKNDVTFKYCFLVKDSSQTEKGVASIQDFNTKADASKYPDFPICKADSSVYGVVKISSGNKTPDVPVYLNAKFDKLDEPTETLKFMVFELGAAVFPEGMSDGVFDLHIQNTPVFNFKDVQDEYTVVENSEEADTVAKIEISGATLTTLVAEMVDDDADTNPVKLDDLFAISVDQTNKYVVITVKDHLGELNFESDRIKKIYNITMTLRDDCNTDNCQERTAKTKIKILDKNEVPKITNVYDPQLAVLPTPFDTLRPKENIPEGDTIGLVLVEDPDIYNVIAFGHMAFRIEDDVPFEMDSLAIVVKKDAKLNHESADSVYTFTVFVDNCELETNGKWNKNCLTAEHEVTVKIANVPEEPEIQCVAGDTKCNGPFAVAENSKTGTKIHDFVVIDPDINQVKTLVPTLTDDDSTNASELFEAVILPPTTTSGDYILRIQVKDSTKLDYETVKPSYKVTVMVTDDDGLTDSIKRVINVLDVNEAPTIENKDDIVIPENLANGEEAGRVFATDPDIKHVEAFGHLSYRIIEDMPFKMDSNKIIVTNADTLNYEALKPDTTFTFNVEVANCLLNTTTNMYTEACLYDTAEVMVSVKDEPEKTIIIPDCTGDECTECSGPDCHDIMDSLCEGPNCTGVHTHDSVLTLAVKENVRTGYTVIDYVVSDEDVGTGHTDALVATFENTNSSGAENLFVAEMKKVSGVWHLIVSVLDSVKFDFEKIEELHKLTIYVNDPEDPAGMGDSIRRIIRVVDVNETPVITDVTDFNKDIEESKKAEFTFYPKENMKNDEAIGIVVASDPDTIHKAEFARLEYSIVDTTGIPFKMKDSLVVVKDSSRINYESNKTKYEFVVQVVNCEWEKSGSDYVKTDRCLDPVKQTIKVEIQNVNEEPIIIVDNGPDGGDDSDSLCVAHCDTTGRGVWKDSTKIDSILTVGVRENTEDGRIYSETGKILFQYHYADEDTGHVAGADVDWFVVDSLSTISSESLENLFKLDFNNGVFTVSVKDETLLDYEKLRNAQKRDDPEPEYTVGIVVTDPDGLADTLYRTIRIIDENEKPLFTAEPCVIVEGNQPGDSIGHVEHPSDIDSLSSNPKLYDNYFKMTNVSEDGLFELRKDSTDLMRVVLAALQSIDCEDTAKYHCGDNTRYWVELTYGDTSLQTVYSNLIIPVTILDLNEKPVINTDTIGVDENSPKGTVVDTIKWEDVDFFDSVMHFEITKDPSGCFVIDEKTGVVTVKSDGCAALDYEKNETLKIEVSVTDLVNVPDSLYDDECACQKIFTKDGRPNTVTKTITVNVHDVNEPPHLDDKVISVSEDTKVLTVIDTVKGTDPDKNTTLVYKTVGGDSDVFDVNHRGEVYVKDTLDYETKKEYKILVEVTDGEYRDTATITINVTNVIEQSKVVITQYDNVDSTWEYPEVVYTNKKEGTITWKQDGVEVSMDTIFTKKGENVIVITYQDPHKDLPGRDTLIVYYNDELPTVEVKGFADVVKAENIYTVVENTGDKDTNLYVNKLNNYILVSVKDPDPLNKRDTVFKVNINLEPVNVSQKTLNKVYEISQSKFILNENPSSEVSKTVMNGSEVEVTYNEVVGKDSVTISYRTDSKGDVVKVPVINSKGEVDSIEVITVSYTAVVEGKNVVISYQADAMTGEILVKDATGALMVSGASKNSTMSATKDSVSTKSDTKKSGVSEGMFTITFSASDPLGNSTVVSYSVDEKNNMVKNAEGDVGYAVTYTYKNRYGNAASQSLFIVLDQVGPKVEILSPAAGEVVRSNFVAVKWTVNGVEQDTLTLEGLRKGANPIVRIYRDKAGNEASDTVLVIMKDSKDVEIAIVDPVTEISKDKVDEYYAENPPEEGETFAVSIRNPSTGEEVETLIGGSFKNKEGSGKAPYPNAKDSKKSVHLGPTLAMDVKLPITNSVGGLATMDDLLSSDGMVPLQGLDAENSVKLTVEEYIREHCDDDVKADDDLSRINLYKSKLHIQIWVYTTIGGFVDYFNFTQDMNDPSFTNEAGMLELYFEMKPDKDGFVRTDEGKGRRLATGAYLYKVEANLTSVLRCTLPSVDYDPKTNTFGSKAKKRGEKVKSSEELLKPFGYKRPKE